MAGYYQANPHYAPDDFSEERERRLRCEQEAGKWFADLTADQLATYRETMSVIAPYQGTPRWDREKAAADFIWQQTTIDARCVYDLALRDLLLTGEVSEATSYVFDEVRVGQVMQAAE